MHKVPKVLSAMTPFPYHIEWEAPLSEAVDQMQAHEIRHLPVMRNGRIHGIVSEADLRMAMSLRAASPEGLHVGLVCTKNPYVVDLETPLAQVAAELASRHVGSAIVERHGKLAGIVTTTDMCRLLAEWLERGTLVPPDDAA